MNLKQKSLSNILIFKKLIFKKFYNPYIFLNQMLNKYLIYLKNSKIPEFTALEKNKLLFAYEEIKEFDLYIVELYIENQNIKLFKNKLKILKTSKKIIKKTFYTKSNKYVGEMSNKNSLFFRDLLNKIKNDNLNNQKLKEKKKLSKKDLIDGMDDDNIEGKIKLNKKKISKKNLKKNNKNNKIKDLNNRKKNNKKIDNSEKIFYE